MTNYGLNFNIFIFLHGRPSATYSLRGGSTNRLMNDRRSISLTRRNLSFALCTGGVALAGCTDAPETTSEAEHDPTPTDAAPPTETGDEDGPEDDTVTCETDSIHEEYDTTELTVVSPAENTLGELTAAIANTESTRRVGLSDTDCLPEDRGMLFTYESGSERTFWMNEMAFGIDIVFIDPESRITTTHHAPAPDEDESGREAHHRYEGYGQYVLETTYEWTTRHGVDTGDTLRR